MRVWPTVILRVAIGLVAVPAASVPALARVAGTELHYRVWTTEEGLPQGSVRAIAQTPDGYIWIATLDGLVRFDGVRMTVFAKSDVPEMTSNRCLSLMVDRRGALWVGTEDGGILQRAGTRFRSFGRSSGLGSEFIGTIAEDASGRIWANTSAGSSIFDGDRWKPADASMPRPTAMQAPPDVQLPSLPAETRRLRIVQRSAESATGKLWVFDGTSLHRRVGESWQAFSSPVPAVVLPAPNCLFEDREGTLWICGERGLVQARPTPVRALVPVGSRDDRNIYTLAEDASGRVWVGAQSRSFLWESGGFSPLAARSWWPKDGMTAIEPHADGSILAGDSSGLFRVWPGRRFEKLRDGPALMDSLRDRRGVLWVATEGGLLRLSGTEWKPIDGLPTNVKVLLEARDGALWVGTYEGLARVADGSVQRWTTAHGLSSDRIRSLREDETGALWIGTYDGGINRFANGRFVAIRKRDGLYDDGAFAILDGGDGRYWMSSNRGIYSVAKRELDAFVSGTSKQVASRAWRSVDGMPSSECNGGRQPSGFRAADGTLWFPTQQGIAVIDPHAVNENTLPPPVVVEEVTTDRRTIPLGEAIELLPGERRLEVRYTANTFVRPEGARFRHRLAPFDDDWVDAGNRRFAQYGNIPPGHYVLTILAANSDGVWSPEGVTLPIKVAPYWWQTLWFQSGAALVALGILSTGYWRRVSSLQRRRAEQDAFARRLLESQEAERKRIAVELHDGIGQTLVVIRNRALLGLRHGGDPAILQQITEISEVAAEGIEDVRKVAYGLRPFQLDRLGLKRALQALVDQTAASSGIPIGAEIGDVDDVIAKHDEINVYRIVQEAVSNMVRHARARSGHVAVTVRGQDIEIRVEDDGAGFDPAAVAPGLGLTGMAERARILGGRATVRSTPGQGTSVIVQVPNRGASSAVRL